MKYKKTFKDAITLIVFITVGCIVGVTFFFALSQGLDKSEVVQCNKLADDATKYPGFYITAQQKIMCDMHNIKIDAPVQGDNSDTV